VHQVFSIPKMLRPRFKFNHSLLHLLFHAARDSWKELVNDALPGCTPASVMALHTAGELLHWHPHSHALALYGGIDQKGNFQPLDSVSTEYLTNCFSRNLLDALLHAGEVRSNKKLLTSYAVGNIPFDEAQGRPFDEAQGRPFDVAQGRPFDVAQGRPDFMSLLESPSAPTTQNQGGLSPVEDPELAEGLS